MATRLFAIFIFLPSLVGYLAYAYLLDQYKSFACHIWSAVYDFFWYFGEYSIDLVRVLKFQTISVPL